MNLHITRVGQGHPLVLFHGWGFDSTIWSSIVPCLINQYQVILVDLPGFGLSPIMSWDDFKANLVAKLPSCFSLAGWSLGGLYAMRFACEEPQKIQTLLNIASSPYFLSNDLWPGVARAVFCTFYQNLLLSPAKTINDFVKWQLNHADVPIENGVLPSEKGLKSGLDILNTWDLREALKQFNRPSCFMFGRLDPITSVKTMHAMKKLYPQFRYVLFNKAAHIPFLSHREEFLKELKAFVQ